MSRPAHRGIELAALVALGVYSSGAFAAPTVYRIDHVGDGDTVVLGRDLPGSRAMADGAYGEGAVLPSRRYDYCLRQSAARSML